MAETHRDRGDRLPVDHRHAASPQLTAEELSQKYDPLVRAIAARLYRRRGDDSVPFADYLQYGRLGLLEAATRYDAQRALQFGGFAATRIRGAILNGLVKESENAAQRCYWRKRSRERVDSLLTAAAPAADRASLAHIAIITVGLAVGALMDESRDEFEPADQNVRNNPYAANEIAQLRSVVKDLVARLPDRERVVIEAHYRDEREFRVIAAKLSVTKSRVAQMHARALLRLRTWLEERPQVDRKV